MTKISDLAAVTSLATGDELVLARAGDSKKIDADYLPGFLFSYATITSNVTISATVQASANTIVSSAAVAFDGSTTVRVDVFCASLEVAANAAGNTMLLNLWGGVGGATDLGILAQYFIGSNTTFRVAPQFSVYLTPSAATHTFILKGWRTNANGTVTTTGTYFPTYIRVTKA